MQRQLFICLMELAEGVFASVKFTECFYFLNLKLYNMKKFCFALCVLCFLTACKKESEESSNDGTFVQQLNDQAKSVQQLNVDAAQVKGGRPFEVTLTGAAEVPGPGDPDGTGT